MLRVLRRKLPTPNVYFYTLRTARAVLVPDTPEHTLRDGDLVHYDIFDRDDTTFFDRGDTIYHQPLGWAFFDVVIPKVRDPYVVLDWSLDTAYYNQGLSTEVLNSLTAFAFYELDVSHVYVNASVHIDNPAKANVAIMSGYTPMNPHSSIYRKQRP